MFDGLADWEYGYAVAGISNPQLQLIPGRYRVRTVALGRQPATTAGGIRIQPDLTLGRLGPKTSAMLILPGGDAWDEERNGEVVEVARRYLAAEVPVAAICGATAGLARAGLLDSRRHQQRA